MQQAAITKRRAEVSITLRVAVATLSTGKVAPQTRVTSSSVRTWTLTRARSPKTLLTQVSGADFGIVEHLLGVATHGDNARLHDVATVGDAERAAAFGGHVVGQETSYSLTFSVRRLSPGDGWFGCIQVLGSADRVLVRPIPYQKPYPATSEEWTRVTETFKLSATIDSANLQIMTKPESLVEVADIVCIAAPTSPPADNYR
jgi:hypothetical protein